MKTQSNAVGITTWLPVTHFFTPKDGKLENLATRRIYNGNYSKQLGYILIDKRYGDWVKEIYNMENANVDNPMQHRAIIAKIRMGVKANYCISQKTACCPYDLSKLRSSPEK